MTHLIRIHLTTVLAMAAFALSITLTTPSIGHAQDKPALAAQSSNEQGVTVKVTPKAPNRDSPRLEFDVVLDTHSADLNDDLAKTATLITDDGREFKPVSWTGAPPGGHHREGVIAFAAPNPWPRAMELKIARAGEAAPRSFRWQF